MIIHTTEILISISTLISDVQHGNKAGNKVTDSVDPEMMCRVVL